MKIKAPAQKRRLTPTPLFNKMWAMKRIFRLSIDAWVFIFLTVCSAIVLFSFVNLVPRVDNNFFFSNTDPQFQYEKTISRMFSRKDSLVIINARGPITSDDYIQKVRDLTDALGNIQGISGVKSITNGPHDIKDALKGPLWKRLLITKDQNSSNIVIFLDSSFSRSLIPKLEALTHGHSSENFHLILSGPPYIVELISRQLSKDIRIFSMLALVIFGIVVLVIFRSPGILLGSVVSCISASMWTLMTVHLLGITLGLLTANLATIVFVITLSHIIFLTYNWKYVLAQGHDGNPVDEAIRLTISPSFWSMMTTLLGFLSLLSVPARPLKELGASGVAGALVALAVAYGVYPAFLRLVEPTTATHNMLDRHQKKIGGLLEKRKTLTIAVIFFLAVLALPGVWRANTDPSLLAFFSSRTQLKKDLTYIDRHGGSSPLILVVRKTNGESLDTDEAYHELWGLQLELERYKEVGSVISLPVLMAQAKGNFLASLLPWKTLLNILRTNKFNEIAKTFVTDDHREGLFMIRMNESNRKVSRLEVIQKIKDMVSAHGFSLELVGGIYNLQGHLSQLVASSIIFGLGQLILIFSIIAWMISRSLRIGAAITLSICLVPVIVLGLIGWLRVPLDTISAPACNIALGLGIDSMIHMVRAYRRQNPKNNKDKDAWAQIRHRFWQPVFSFTLIMVLGFGIFAFSQFPSTQRFGSAVVFGTIIASMTALFVMPMICQLDFKTIRKLFKRGE